MSDLILQSLGLLIGVFAIAAGLGWLLAGRAVSERSAFERRPRGHLLDAAETFTSGVVVPFKTAAEPAPAPDPKPAPKPSSLPAYVPLPMPRYEMAASNIAILREDRSLQTRAASPSPAPAPANLSTLARMTPDSVAAAVQQAGSGLAPARLDAPKGAADDLTLISGIDETRQRALNELGIYHFWQVAGWTPEHVAWLASRVEGRHASEGGESSRIARENWMAQAAKLAQLS
ncbi:MAG: hypothetical protein ACXU8U_04525 [Asticcacaulis sp.]